MLHKETVSADTFELIIKLLADPLLNQFYLVGGTGLALQLGHLESLDIELFSNSTFDTSLVLEHLERAYAFQLQYQHHNTLKGIVKGVFF